MLNALSVNIGTSMRSVANFASSLMPRSTSHFCAVDPPQHDASTCASSVAASVPQPPPQHVCSSVIGLFYYFPLITLWITFPHAVQKIHNRKEIWRFSHILHVYEETFTRSLTVSSIAWNAYTVNGLGVRRDRECYNLAILTGNGVTADSSLIRNIKSAVIHRRCAVNDICRNSWQRVITTDECRPRLLAQ